jgi:hypothetical protein
VTAGHISRTAPDRTICASSAFHRSRFNWCSPIGLSTTPTLADAGSPSHHFVRKHPDAGCTLGFQRMRRSKPEFNGRVGRAFPSFS